MSSHPASEETTRQATELLSRIVKNLNRQGAEYLIIGGLAVREIVPNRLTSDIDLWVRPSIENAPKVAAALIDSGFDENEIGSKLFEFVFGGMSIFLTHSNRGIELDVLTDGTVSGQRLIKGFENAWSHREVKLLDGEPANYLCAYHLAINKLSSSWIERYKDYHDARAVWAYENDRILIVDGGGEGGSGPLPPSFGPSTPPTQTPPKQGRSRMLSIEPVAGGGDYHAYLLSEYYLGEQQAGKWAGQGAQALGLTGEVETATFAKLMDGYAVDGKPLVQNAGVREGKRAHEPGWDLTFSVPKDVSVLWAVADPVTREKIGRCQEAAVTDALGYIERAAGQSRQKAEHGGVAVPTEAKLVFATYGHGTSREKDPQLHTHCVTFNVAVRSDGSTGAVVSRSLYRHKMAAGAVYQATLAGELVRELGIQLTTEKHGFRVNGTPTELSREFSKRSKQIEAALAEKGTHTAEASALIAKETRKGKTVSAAKDLSEQWQQTAERFGFTAESVLTLLNRVKPNEKAREKRIAQVVTQSVTELLKQESYFAEKTLVRAVADRLRDGTAVGRDVCQAVTEWTTRPEVVTCGIKNGERQLTTHAVVEREKRLIANAAHLAEQKSHAVSDRALATGLSKFPEQGVSPDDAKRNKGQRAAFEHLIKPDGLSILSGMPGTGKSTILETCREAWEKSGYRVIGVAQAGRAKEELRKASGIESETLAMRLNQLEEKGLAGIVWHHIKQVVKTAANELHKDVNLPVHQLRPFKLDRKTIVVLDEAGMVGTKDFGRLLQAVREAGAKLVAVGDAKQLQPIGAGAPFAYLKDQHEAAKLTHITRQRLDLDDKIPTWKRDAVTLFEADRSAKALAMFAERGAVKVEQSRDEAKKKLVSEWALGGGVAKPAENLILAGTKEDARDLNALCQKERLKQAPSGEAIHAVEVKGVTIFTGDRVTFTQKSRSLGIENGDCGAVKKISGLGRLTSVVVETDDGRTVKVPFGKYTDLALGYAMTTHKAQGATVENAYVLIGGSMQDQHLSYVQASRARGTTKFYADRIEAGPELATMAKAMGVSRQKDMAHSVVNAPQQISKRPSAERNGSDHERENRT